MNPILHDYAINGTPIPRDTLEAAAQDAKFRLSPEERGELNDALLQRLSEAKEAYPHAWQRRDYLCDPTISALVNTLATINEPFLLSRVKHFKQRSNSRETIEELASTALAGRCGFGADAGGLMGAILEFDYRPEIGKDGNGARFSAMMKVCIDRAMFPTERETRRASHAVSLDECMEGGEPTTWVDRHAKQPVKLLISAELRQRLDQAVEKLPPDQRAVAEFVIDFIETRGRKPTGKEVGDSRGVTRQMGMQLYEKTFDRLRAILKKDNPNLAAEGIGGYREFAEAFPKTRQVVGV